MKQPFCALLYAACLLILTILSPTAEGATTELSDVKFVNGLLYKALFVDRYFDFLSNLHIRVDLPKESLYNG